MLLSVWCFVHLYITPDHHLYITPFVQSDRAGQESCRGGVAVLSFPSKSDTVFSRHGVSLQFVVLALMTLRVVSVPGRRVISDPPFSLLVLQAKCSLL